MLESKAKGNVPNHDRYAALALGALACLAAGLITVYWLMGGYASTPAPAPTAPPVAAQAPDDQVSVLLLVVNDRTVAKPDLVGCWVVTFQPGTGQYFLLGFPVEMPVDPAYTLRDYYNADRNLEDKSRFVEEALKILSQGGLKIRYRVYVDEASLAEMVDRVGGLALMDGQPPLSGAELRNQYTTLAAGDPQTRIEFQRQALEAFTQALKRQTWTADDYQNLYNRFQALSPDAAELLDLARGAGPLAEANFTIRIASPAR